MKKHLQMLSMHYIWPDELRSVFQKQVSYANFQICGSTEFKVAFSIKNLFSGSEENMLECLDFRMKACLKIPSMRYKNPGF